MILVIDVGNSEIDFGLFERGAVRFHFSKGTDLSDTPEEIGLFLTQMLNGYRIAPSRIKGLAVGSVVPEMTGILLRMLGSRFSQEPFVVAPDGKLPIRLCLDSPNELGADRLANAAAAFQKFGGPVIVIDCGSATTLNAVTRDGEFPGGAILPGLPGMMKALSRQTAKLPHLPLERPARFIGRNTSEAMRSGVINGYCGALRHLVAGISEELSGTGRKSRVKGSGSGVRIVATGGLGEFLGTLCPWIDAVEPTLTLEGIARIFEAHG